MVLPLVIESLANDGIKYQSYCLALFVLRESVYENDSVDGTGHWDMTQKNASIMQRW